MDRKLYCKSCKSQVWVGLDYDGYHARCNCRLTSYYFRVGSGERPRMWIKGDDLSYEEKEEYKKI